MPTARLGAAVSCTNVVELCCRFAGLIALLPASLGAAFNEPFLAPLVISRTDARDAVKDACFAAVLEISGATNGTGGVLAMLDARDDNLTFVLQRPCVSHALCSNASADVTTRLQLELYE